MDQLPTKSIEEVTQTLIDYRGKTPPKTSSGVKLITAKVIKEGFIQDGNHEYIAEEMYDPWMRRGLPKQWDILITTEAPLGEVAQIRTDEKVALAQRVILLRGNPNIIDQSYYFHVLQSPFVQGQLKARATGTTVFGIKQKELRKIQIPLFSLPAQEKIGGILSAYADLIGNNNRRIALLEEAIHRLYREWFVYLRFPGHEHTPVVAGVPEGWEKRPLAKLLDYHIGGGWGKDEYTEGYTDLAYVFRGTDIPKLKSGDTNSVPLRFHTTSNLASRKIQSGDLILEVSNGKIENVGRTLLVTRQLLEAFPEPVMCASFCKLLRTKANFPSFLLMLHIEQMNESGELGYFKNPSAAGINNFRFKDFLTNAEILIPGPKIMADVKEFLEPSILMITNLRTQIRKLQEARDALLPRLMNGSLPV